MDFRKVDSPRKKSSSVADQILDAIRTDTYQEGSRLPSERELARLMGVSRNSVREAISALQIAGFVTTKVGEGTYVDHVAPLRLTQGVSWLSDGGINLLGIWQARNEIEQILLQEVLEKATTADIDGLKAVLSDMEDAIAEGSNAKFSVNDVAFHLNIAGLSDNFPIVRAEHQLLSVSRQFYRILDYSESPRSLQHLEVSAATHRGIVDAIENRDSVAATRAADAHFQRLKEYLLEAFESTSESRALLGQREST